MTDPITLPCGCKVWLNARGEVEMRLAGCSEGLVLKCNAFAFSDETAEYRAFCAHFTSQVAAAREAVTREVAATLEGLASDDPQAFEKARTSEMGQMVRKAARKRGME